MPHYQQYDTVRLVVPLEHVPAGTIGVIVEPPRENCALVEFYTAETGGPVEEVPLSHIEPK